jgi:hypothetical protein
MMLDQKGDAPGAIRELDEALRLRPTHTAAREALATIKTRAARPR